MSKDYFPPMHSAEHILNQVMVRHFTGRRSYSNHIERKKSKCDYHFDRNLNAEEITFIEENVNEAIQQNLDVTEEFLTKDYDLSKFNLEKIPDDSGDTIRIIRIGNYDSCPCSGLHVMNTSEIGKFKIVSTSHEDGVLRIRFKLDRSEIEQNNYWSL
ncbi:MAG: hypothetical protein KJ799_17420 [Bacteroidetes bacterium]|nr:hypothetical protein [Bacteroidota bacterium]MBU1680543.1 hypothetical protein [Bacteroidota bacterium]MBU2508479.1 hypothetical protein [Bacteroidota bacterium]